MLSFFNMNLIEVFSFQDTTVACDVIILPSAFRKSSKMLDMFLPTLVGVYFRWPVCLWYVKTSALVLLEQYLCFFLKPTMHFDDAPWRIIQDCQEKKWWQKDTTRLTSAHIDTGLFRIFIASESSILLVCYTTYKCLLKIARRVETIIRSVNLNCDSMVNT